jgi:hypothetical protein
MFSPGCQLPFESSSGSLGKEKRHFSQEEADWRFNQNKHP